jgi:hypothetical protein
LFLIGWMSCLAQQATTDLGIRSTELPAISAGPVGFRRVPESESGVQFINSLDEWSGAANRVLYNGAGLAAGDVNGDGLPDLFFCDLGGTNRLYLNRGGWRFEEATSRAGLSQSLRYSRGAVLADLDGDADLDLLVSVNGRGVLCFLNDGQGQFRDVSAEAGTTGSEGSTSMTLADVDGNGTLDLYIANYRTDDVRDRGQVRFRMIQGRPVLPGSETNRFALKEGRLEEFGQADRLLLNDGQGRFREVSWSGGAFLDADGRPLTEPPRDWGLMAAFRDLNGDGAPDLYVCNDYWTPDRLWWNDGQGRFRAAGPQALRHLSASSMSVDFSDVDRDGDVDFFVVDMLSRDPVIRKRQKDAQPPPPPGIGVGDDVPQHSHNTLFLSRGDGTFAEVAHWANVPATDWSWAPLFLDVDLDGYDDLVVGAGHFRDVQDFDAEADVQSRQHSWDAVRNDAERQRLFTQELLEHYRLYPLLQLPIAGFRNRGDGRFEEMTSAWGLAIPGVHQGIVSADFDGDGDLDLAVNRLNAPALLLENTGAGPRIAVRLRGRAPNTGAIGARVTLHTEGQPSQQREIMAGGRYLSSCDAEVAFAGGDARASRRLEVRWRSGAVSIVPQVGLHRRYVIEEPEPTPGSQAASPGAATAAAAAAVPWFRDASGSLAHIHTEVPYDERSRQPLAPYRLSQMGPGVAWVDFNGDGHDDLAVGAARGQALALFAGDGRGGFQAWPNGTGLLVPDDTTGLVGGRGADGGWLMAGLTGFEQSGVPAVLAWSVRSNAVSMTAPAVAQPAPAGALALGDPRGDGRLALFVAGGVMPGRYPLGAPSRLFWKAGAQWTPDLPSQVLFDNLGIVNAALWADLDQDGRSELILACEWGPLRVFRFEGTGLRETTSEWGLSGWTGLWRGVASGDLNGDGRVDLVASNWGLNTPWQASEERPLTLAYGTLSQPGTLDLIETEWVGTGLAPRRSLVALAGSLPFLLGQFPDHRAYAQADLETVLGERSRLARRVGVHRLESTLFLNTGSGFEAVALPREAQWSPGFGVVVADLDGDGRDDVFLGQNLFGLGPDLPRQDAGTGLLLRGDGAGGLYSVAPRESGIQVWGEQRGVAVGDYDQDGRPDLVVTQNGAPTRLFHNVGGRPGLRVRLVGSDGNPMALGAQIRPVRSGKPGPVREVQAGNGYQSQNSAVVVMGPREEVTAVWVRWPGGRVTTIEIPPDVRGVSIDVRGVIVARE